MAKNQVKISANVVDTVRPKVAGEGRNPAIDAVRALFGRITTPLLPDDYLKLANPLWSARELRGRVVEVRRETEDSATLVIKPGWGFTFDYQAGQYIGIGLLVDGRWRWRSYSLTSSPHADGAGRSRTITITVKAMPEGFLSTHLVGGVTPRHDRAAGRTAGQFRDAGPVAGVGVVLDRRLRNHPPGDVDAADAGAPRSDRRPRSYRPYSFGPPNRIRRDVRRGSSRSWLVSTTGIG